jgi:hypothetical protein
MSLHDGTSQSFLLTEKQSRAELRKPKVLGVKTLTATTLTTPSRVVCPLARSPFPFPHSSRRLAAPVSGEKSETAPSSELHTPIRDPSPLRPSHLRRAPAIPPRRAPAACARPIAPLPAEVSLVSAPAQFGSESRGFRGRASRFLIAWLFVSCAIRR